MNVIMSTTVDPDHSLQSFLDRGPYVGYCYSYPHKTAYRSLPKQTLKSVWQDESTESLFLYAHVPFCEFRCGFCNLFTFSQPAEAMVADYLAAFTRQAKTVADSLPDAKFGQVAIGGGTPSFLSAKELGRFFKTLSDVLNVNGRDTPIGIEVSPATVDTDKLALMRDFGVDRVSMGVQSFDQNDIGSLGRPQKQEQVMRSVELIRQFDFQTMNLDLIYGGENQSIESWLASIDATVQVEPEEIYVYPLYVRNLTGLSKRVRCDDDRRLELYQLGRSRLIDAGYQQVSMRMFCKPNSETQGVATDYRCQADGMVGLGCGARSYTRTLHYGGRYGVRQSAIAKIISQYVQQSDVDFRHVDHGIALDQHESRRRFVILSLFLVTGFLRQDYHDQFGQDVLVDFPELTELVANDMAEVSPRRVKLTELGISYSDAIGPWLYSQAVHERMEQYQWEMA